MKEDRRALRIHPSSLIPCFVGDHPLARTERRVDADRLGQPVLAERRPCRRAAGRRPGPSRSPGVIHRHTKPSNLLLDEKGTVWVTDFGLAKADSDADKLTHTGDILGTLRYLAPERFNGQGDFRSDVYSLGLTLYELLT